MGRKADKLWINSRKVVFFEQHILEKRIFFKFVNLFFWSPTFRPHREGDQMRVVGFFENSTWGTAHVWYRPSAPSNSSTVSDNIDPVSLYLSPYKLLIFT